MAVIVVMMFMRVIVVMVVIMRMMMVVTAAMRRRAAARAIAQHRLAGIGHTALRSFYRHSRPAIRAAAQAAPKPLSILKTPMPGAQLESMLFNAPLPPSATP